MSSRRKRAKKPPKKHILKFVLTMLLAIVVGFSGLSALGVYALVRSWQEELPDIQNIVQYGQEQKTRIFASDGETLLAEFFYRDRTPVTSDQVAPHVFNAIVAIEDERFWQHNGVDYYGIARAAFYDLTTSSVQGASTITMQLVRQTIMQDEAYDMTMRRKVREATLAMQLEEIWSKDQILMTYLNTINFGDGCWGIQAAAEHYFSKDAADLTLAEAALLCGIPQSPSFNNPVYYPDNAIARRNNVLERMCVNGYINDEEKTSAQAAELDLHLRSRTGDGIYLVPYATSFVRQELFNMLSTDKVLTGGLDVYTSINLQYQWWADEACRAREERLPEGFEVSLTCVDPNTGFILCMRGGRDYYSDQFNTCWQMRRQAGSSFKTFGLVAAIELGYSPQIVVSTDSPVVIGDWRPANYSGAGMGDMTLAQATWQSSNTAYARVVRTIGPEAIANVATRMGITSPLLSVNSIVLGSNGVCTLEMASAYGTLATGGVHNKPTSIMRIVERRTDQTIFNHEPLRERVLTPEVAFAATSVLRGVVWYGTGTAASISGRAIAGKTGTSDQWKDAWFIGYTPQLSTAVWIGNRDAAVKMNQYGLNEGGVVCAPVWNQFMRNTLADMSVEEFEWAAAPPYRPGADFMTAEERETKKLKETDSDGDGYSDWDEKEAGTNPNDPSDYPGRAAEIDRLKRTDSDGDGWSDWDEKQAGTDPYDPNDYPGAPVIVPPTTLPTTPPGSGGTGGSGSTGGSGTGP